MSQRNLILVLGDQLSHNLSSLQTGDKDKDRILMCEVLEETQYVRHHKKKIAFLFSAMRHFACELGAMGWDVDYTKLDDPNNRHSFSGEVRRAIECGDFQRIIVTEPGEYRVLKMINAWERDLGTPVDILADCRFIATHEEFRSWAEGRKQLRMEYFYREMRRKTGLLMNGHEPEGGRWNFDSENRKRANPDLFMPNPLEFQPDQITRQHEQADLQVH